MTQLLVRDIEVATVNSLKKLARQHDRSLQAEVKSILETAAAHVANDRAKLASKIRKKLSSKLHSDSVKLLARRRDNDSVRCRGAHKYPNIKQFTT